LLGLSKLIIQIYSWFKHQIDFLRITKQIKKVKNDKKVVFFFPFFHIGGAELVHLNIVESIKDYNTLTFFTMSSHDEKFKDRFYNSSECIDISQFVRTHRDRVRISNIISRKINLQSNVKVFGCNSYIFYFVIDRIRPEIEAIDLIHAFTNDDEIGHEKESISSLNRINQRVVITQDVKNRLNELYKKHSIPEDYLNRIKVIYNATDFQSNQYPIKNNKFTLLYVGRNSLEKRIHIIGEIASKLKSVNLNTEVVLIGSNLESGILEKDRVNCTFIGSKNHSEIKKIYEKSQAILITSMREGFPLVFMESMIFGCVPISTNVGGIPELIKNQVNGILIDNDKNEQEIINEFCSQIESLVKNAEKYDSISENAFQFANAKFGMQRFRKEYRNLLLNA
jgi:glycosyltransferase involved in cell wall biosynthesis